MHYSDHETTSTRLAMVTETRELQQASHIAGGAFYDDLSSYIASDGVIFYGLAEGNPSAAVLSETDADTAELKVFRTQNITGRSVDLSVSALGKQLKGFDDDKNISSQLEKSLVGTYRGRHINWAPRPILRDGAPIAVAQVAFDEIRGNRSLDTDGLEAIWDAHHSIHQEIANAFHDVSMKYNKPIKNTLELLPPSTPNAVVIRWDLDNSTELALGAQYGTIRNFLDDQRLLAEQATTGISNVVVNAGDGQYIIIPFAGNMSSEHISDPAKIKLFNTQRIDPLLERLQKNQLELRVQYPDLEAVHVSIDAEVGHVEKDSEGNFDGPVLWSLAKKTKK
jgi:hypothetical protein